MLRLIPSQLVTRRRGILEFESGFDARWNSIDVNMLGAVMAIACMSYGAEAAPRALCKIGGRRGFSLLELLAVMSILGIIATVILPRIVDVGGRSKQKVRDHHLSTIDEAVERYFIVEGVWPSNDLSDIGANPAYFPDGLPTDPVSGNAYRLDATSKRAIVGSGPGGVSLPAPPAP